MGCGLFQRTNRRVPNESRSFNDVIAGMMDLIAQGEAAWMDLYQKLGVEPLTVVYEEFSHPDGYEPTIRRVLEHLDLDHMIDIPRPRTTRQADHISMTG